MEQEQANHLSKKAGYLLAQHHFKLCLAESCTGGLTGDLITNISGSSDYFLGGVIVYSNEVKRDLIKVKSKTLEKFGAVSRETALEMADGVRKLFASQNPIDQIISLSITGIAGPGGGSPDKPVGIVWIGLSWKKGSFAWKHLWNGKRVENKMLSALAALQHLCDILSDPDE